LLDRLNVVVVVVVVVVARQASGLRVESRKRGPVLLLSSRGHYQRRWRERG
jgi:hypothetical protein